MDLDARVATSGRCGTLVSRPGRVPRWGFSPGGRCLPREFAFRFRRGASNQGNNGNQGEEGDQIFHCRILSESVAARIINSLGLPEPPGCARIGLIAFDGLPDVPVERQLLPDIHFVGLGEVDGIDEVFGGAFRVFGEEILFGRPRTVRRQIQLVAEA